MSCKKCYENTSAKPQNSAGTPVEPTSEGAFCAQCGSPLQDGSCAKSGCSGAQDNPQLPAVHLLSTYPENWSEGVKKTLGGLGIDSATAAVITTTQDRVWMYLPRCPYCKHWVSPKTGVCRYKKCPQYLKEVVEPTGWQWPPSAPSYTKFLHVAKKQDWLAKEKWQARVAAFDPTKVFDGSTLGNAVQSYEQFAQEVEALYEMSKAVHGQKEFGPEWYGEVVDKANAALSGLDLQTLQALAYQQGFMFPSLLKNKITLALWLNPAYQKATEKLERVQQKALDRYADLEASYPVKAASVFAQENNLAQLLKGAGADVPDMDAKYSAYALSQQSGIEKFEAYWESLKANGKISHYGAAFLSTASQIDEFIQTAQKYLIPYLANKDSLSKEEAIYLHALGQTIRYHVGKFPCYLKNDAVALIGLGIIPPEDAEELLARLESMYTQKNYSLPSGWEEYLQEKEQYAQYQDALAAKLPPYAAKIIQKQLPRTLSIWNVKGKGATAAAHKAMLARGLSSKVGFAKLEDIVEFVNDNITAEDLERRGVQQRVLNLMKKIKPAMNLMAVYSDDNGVKAVIQQGDGYIIQNYNYGKGKGVVIKEHQGVSDEEMQVLFERVKLAGGAIHCPNCGRFVSPTATKCQYCWNSQKLYKLYSVPKPQAAPPVQQQPTTNELLLQDYCPKCGAFMSQNAPCAKCNGIGEPPQGAAPKKAQSPAEPPASKEEDDFIPATPAASPAQAAQPKPQSAFNLPKLNLNFGNVSGVTATGNNFLAHLKQVQEQVAQKAKEGFGREIPLVNYAALKLTNIGDANLGGMHQKFLLRDEQGNPHLFKPDKHTKSGAKAYAEKAAADVFQRLGLSAAPVEVIKDGSYLGSVQPLIAGVKRLGGNPSGWKKEQVLDVVRSAVGNWLISDHDGNGDNYLVTGRGTAFRCDMGQAFRYFPNDQLSTDYHPNGSYGAHEPVTNGVWRRLQKGELPLSEAEVAPAVLDVVRRAEKVSDEDYATMVRPLAQSAVNGVKSEIGWFAPVKASAQKTLKKKAVSDQEVADEFVRLVVERKQNLRTDFENFLKGIYGPSFSFQKYE